MLCPLGCPLPPRSRRTLTRLQALPLETSRAFTEQADTVSSIHSCPFPTLSLSPVFCHRPAKRPLSPAHSPWHLEFLLVVFQTVRASWKCLYCRLPQAQWERLPRQGWGHTGKEERRGTGKRGSQSHDCTSSPAAAEHWGKLRTMQRITLELARREVRKLGYCMATSECQDSSSPKHIWSTLPH